MVFADLALGYGRGHRPRREPCGSGGTS